MFYEFLMSYYCFVLQFIFSDIQHLVKGYTYIYIG